MTEVEWIKSSNPQQMLMLINTGFSGCPGWPARKLVVSERKLDLFAEACAGLCNCQLGHGDQPDWSPLAWAALVDEEGCGCTRAARADLLRHIFGNPFARRFEIVKPIPVVALAEALYAGTDCGFALHDALLEMDLPREPCDRCEGQGETSEGCRAGIWIKQCRNCHGTGTVENELVRHFRDEKAHPVGCWAIDAILGLS